MINTLERIEDIWYIGIEFESNQSIEFRDAKIDVTTKYMRVIEVMCKLLTLDNPQSSCVAITRLLIY